MYDFFLIVHSWLRWITLLLAVVVIFKSYAGWFVGGTYSRGDNGLAASFVGTLHLQLLIGLVLYVFLSPITSAAFQDFGAAMKDSAVRYWAVEHIFVMIIGIIIAQVGRTKAKKSYGDVKKFRTQAIFFTIAILLILSRIPFAESGRLFRF
ncbi:MAG: hypothetical protein RIF33_09860 [Cyclobacteriaceae bacterium]